jgi:hypothetical protein
VLVGSASSRQADLMGEVWTPGKAGPDEDFVSRIHSQIRRFAQERGLEQAAVELELRDGSRFALDAILPEPGYGFVTIRPHPGDEDVAPELIIPVGLIERIELHTAEDTSSRLGFSVPD